MIIYTKNEKSMKESADSEKINTIDKPLAGLPKEEKDIRHKLPTSSMNQRMSTIHPADIKKIIDEHSKQLYPHNGQFR